MKYLAIAATVALISASSGAIESSKAKVTRIVDGDTVEVQIGTKTEKVRLIGIDTPEKHESSKLNSDAARTGQDKAAIKALGELASKYTEKHLLNKTVKLEFKPDEKRDRYGRLLAYVRLADGTDFNRNIIADGYANAYTKYPHARMDSYRAAERMARERKQGLWGGGVQQERTGTTPQRRPSVAHYASRNSQVFHSAGCSYVARITAGNRIAFTSRDAAVQSGRRPCKRCKP